MNHEYKPVLLFGHHSLKIGGKQVYHHYGREEYAIERDHRHLVALTESEQAILDHALAWERAELDAQDRRDDDGKQMSGEYKPLAPWIPVPIKYADNEVV